MKKPLALFAAAMLCVACAPAGDTTAAGPATMTPYPSASVFLSADGGPQAPGSTVPATLGIAWDQASKDAAVQIAQDAMADFARPSVEERLWANDVARWLTPQATADYSFVNPSTIPASKVTGPATLVVDEANGFGVIATIPTNAGVYSLQLLRTDKKAPWKVNRFTPPSS